jgi:hypothetical protein
MTAHTSTGVRAAVGVLLIDELDRVDDGFEAMLQSQISSVVQDRVVAEAEYTCAIGDKIIIPASLSRGYPYRERDSVLRAPDCSLSVEPLFCNAVLHYNGI